MSAITYSADELRMSFFKQYEGIFVGPPAFMNNTYCAVTRQWVEKRFAGYMWNFEMARGQTTWRKRGNQCEHFALRAALEVVDLFRQMPDSEVPAAAESIAVGAIKYERAAGTDAATWHEINLWYLERVWCEWEPQTRTFIKFTAAERATVQQLIVP